jgi:hypothetical protein
MTFPSNSPTAPSTATRTASICACIAAAARGGCVLTVAALALNSGLVYQHNQRV